MSDPLTQARDRIAELCGWKRWHVKGDGIDHEDASGWYRRSKTLADPKHPIPASLDFVSRVWPEGVTWDKVYSEHDWKVDWGAYGYKNSWLSEYDDELTARLELLAQALVWIEEYDPPAFAAAVEKIRKEIA